MDKKLAPKSCGVLLVRGEPIQDFLLMIHLDRLDLPKGHVEPGESEIECALREMEEETGISAADIQLDPTFRFQTEYWVQSRRTNHERVLKTTVIFLARMIKRDVGVSVSEHAGFAWYRWAPPHEIQAQTIDPLLACVEQHLRSA